VTEREWLASDSPARLLRLVTAGKRRGPAGGKSALPARKLRLFACAAARLAWDWMTEADSRAAVETAEQAADGARPAEADLGEARIRAGAAQYTVWDRKPRDARAWAASLWAYLSTMEADNIADYRQTNGHLLAPAVSAVQQAALLREIFGNPFRTTTFHLADLSPSAGLEGLRAMAERAYADEDFAALPVLADALEDAGCDDADLLAHLRGPGPHARGCWALDRVLGKR
jgi:hypothetical protein